MYPGLYQGIFAKNRKNRRSAGESPIFLARAAYSPRSSCCKTDLFVEISPTLPSHCRFIRLFFDKNSARQPATLIKLSPRT
jgi:hypothetical protein